MTDIVDVCIDHGERKRERTVEGRLIASIHSHLVLGLTGALWSVDCVPIGLEDLPRMALGLVAHARVCGYSQRIIIAAEQREHAL